MKGEAPGAPEPRRRAGGLSDGVSDLLLFVSVADAGGITAAAARLGSSPALVSRRLAAIEARLGVRLAERNARRFALTDEGKTYLARGREILQASREAEAEVSARGGEARGGLRVGAPVELGRRCVADLVAGFVGRHPGVEVLLELSDAGFEIGPDGLDVALRFDLPADRTVAARRIATTPRILCASPSYLSRAGAPLTPDDLARHECLRLTRRLGRSEPWLIRDGDQVFPVHVAGRLSSGNDEIIHHWALAGLGIAREALWDVEDDLRQGRLVEVLADHRCDVVGLHAVFRQAPAPSARVRLFIEHVQAHFAVMGDGARHVPPPAQRPQT